VDLLEIADAMPIARVAQLTRLPVEDATAYRVAFLRFVEDSRIDWPGEMAAWNEYRSSLRKEKQSRATAKLPRGRFRFPTATLAADGFARHRARRRAEPKRSSA
jgi:hypothetical protein